MGKTFTLVILVCMLVGAVIATPLLAGGAQTGSVGVKGPSSAAQQGGPPGGPPSGGPPSGGPPRDGKPPGPPPAGGPPDGAPTTPASG